MARSARKLPTLAELDQRLTRVEAQLADMAKAVTDTNPAAVKEMREFTREFTEVRAALAATTTRADLAAMADTLQAEIRTISDAIRGDLGAKIDALHAAMLAGFSGKSEH
jgi:uncharacterized protein involved in exopolysaccharide biosynthesis